MKLCIVNNSKLFLPEAAAYQKHFTKLPGFTALTVQSNDEARDTSADIYLRFGGLLHKSVAKTRKNEIHEYHSCSTGAFPRLKNFIKSLCSLRCGGVIFLNAEVRSAFPLLSKKPYIYRDMGAECLFASCGVAEDFEFDVVYAGSITGRPGVVEAISILADKGLSVAVAGRDINNEMLKFELNPNVTFFGMLSANAVQGLYRRSYVGLNLIPDKYPFQFQTATKVIEYLALRKPIISNSYQWIDDHSNSNSYNFIDIDDISNDDVLMIKARSVPVSGYSTAPYSWDYILESSGIAKFLLDVSNAKN